MRSLMFVFMTVLIFGVAASPVLQNGFVYAQTSEEYDGTNSNGEEYEVKNPNDKQSQHIEDRKQKLQAKLDAMKEKRNELYEKRKIQLMEKFSNMSEDRKQKLQAKLDAMKENLQVKLDLNRDNTYLNRSDDPITLTNPRIVDAFGNGLFAVSVDQQIQIAADITSNNYLEQPFVYYIISNEAGYEKWITGSLGSGQSFSPALSWIPTDEGTYRFDIYVLDNISDKNKLAPGVTLSITVGTNVLTPTPNPSGEEYDYTYSTQGDYLINKDTILKLASVCELDKDGQNEFYSTHAEYDQELLMDICAKNDKDSRINKLFEHIDDIYRKFVTNTPQGFADMTIDERQLEVQKMRDERKLEREHRQNMTIEEKQAYHDNIREKIQEKRESHVSPFGQMSLGLVPIDIMCDDEKVLVIKVSNGMPLCLEYSSAVILMDREMVTFPQ